MQFHKDGILVVKGFLKLDDVEAMRAAMMQLVDEMDPAEHHGEFSTTENVQVRALGPVGDIIEHNLCNEKDTLKLL